MHDVDNDGWDDIVTSAATSSGAPLMLRNRGLGDAGLPRFEVLGDEGAGEYFVTGVDADLDRDGRVDSLLLAWEPARPSRLFRNTSGGGHWLQVDLSHIDDPVGAEIRVLEPTTGERVGSEWIEGTTGYGAGGNNVGHVGLGATTPEEVVVEVSAAGRDSVIGRVRIDRRSGFAGCAR